MEEKLIKYEVAKLAKEKGFDIFQKNQYSQNSNTTTLYSYTKNQCVLFGDVYYVPTQSLLQKWIRETHEIFIDISTISKDEFGVIVGRQDEDDWIRSDEDGEAIFYNTYEDALEVGLFESLKLIK